MLGRVKKCNRGTGIRQRENKVKLECKKKMNRVCRLPFSAANIPKNVV